MKRGMPVYIMLLLLALLAGGCGKKSETAVRTREPGKLKVVFVDGEDRFTRNNGGAPAGAEEDIARRAAEALGVEADFQLVEDESSLFEAVRNGSCDLGFGRIANSDERLTGLEVSSSYGEGGLFLVTQRNNYLDSLSIMETGSLGVTGTVEPLSEQIAGMDHMSREVYADAAAMGEDIVSGKLRAGVATEREALRLLSGKLQAQELIKGPRQSYVAVLPADSALKETVNQAISEQLMEQIGLLEPEEENGEEEQE